MIYRCNKKYVGEKCQTPTITEERLKVMFMEAINRLIANKDEIINNLEQLIEIKEADSLEGVLRVAAASVEKSEQEYRALIEQQKYNPIPFEEYEIKIKLAAEAYDKANSEYEELRERIQIQDRMKYETEKAIKNLSEQDEILSEYSFDLMKRTLQGITVHRDKKVIFHFRGEINIEISL